MEFAADESNVSESGTLDRCDDQQETCEETGPGENQAAQSGHVGRDPRLPASEGEKRSASRPPAEDQARVGEVLPKLAGTARPAAQPDERPRQGIRRGN